MLRKLYTNGATALSREIITQKNVYIYMYDPLVLLRYIVIEYKNISQECATHA